MTTMMEDLKVKEEVKVKVEVSKIEGSPSQVHSLIERMRRTGRLVFHYHNGCIGAIDFEKLDVLKK